MECAAPSPLAPISWQDINVERQRRREQAEREAIAEAVKKKAPSNGWSGQGGMSVGGQANAGFPLPEGPSTS